MEMAVAHTTYAFRFGRHNHVNSIIQINIGTVKTNNENGIWSTNNK